MRISDWSSDVCSSDLVTPLVDVMLVLLIIFMVTAPLLVTGVPVNLPETRANSLDQTQEPVQVSLDDEGRVYIDDVETLMSDLPERFEDIRNTKGDATESPTVYLRADRGLDYGQGRQVRGGLNGAGESVEAWVEQDGAE